MKQVALKPVSNKSYNLHVLYFVYIQDDVVNNFFFKKYSIEFIYRN